MPPRLEPVREALRALPDDLLQALQDAAFRMSNVAPGFTAWIRHVSDWEIDRRAGLHYFLLFPEELARPHEFVYGAKSALAEIERALGDGGHLFTVVLLLDALAALVRRCERYP